MNNPDIMALARRIALFGYDYDTYGFMDFSDVGESTADAIERLTLQNYDLLMSGDYDTILDWVDEDTLGDDPRLRKEWRSIKKEISKLRRNDRRRNRSIQRFRRRIGCNL